MELAGERYVLRLTLQALAEIEAAFEAPDLQALGERLGHGRFSARDLVMLIGAAIRGGGAMLSDAEIAGRIGAQDLPKLVQALGDVFTQSFGPGESAGRVKKPRATVPERP